MLRFIDEWLFGSFEKRERFIERHFPVLVGNPTIIKTILLKESIWRWHWQDRTLVIQPSRVEVLTLTQTDTERVNVVLYDLTNGTSRKGYLPRKEEQ